MQQSYTRNYVKIYIWQTLAIVLNLLSLVIVIPKLSSRPDVYGVYSICISATLFLSYADLGFMNAGFKFASEEYAKGNRGRETAIIGFTGFILSVFVALFMLSVFALGMNVQWIMKDPGNPDGATTARILLITLAAFAPNVILQRILQLIFGIRIEDYIFQRIQLAINLIKILSVYFFFSNGHYNITGYFLCIQLLTTLGYLVGLFIARRRYQISILKLIRSIRFNSEIFSEVKGLAFSTIFLTISWILYYELGIYAIGILADARAVAYYSIGITCLSFFRTIFGTLFNPFSARFNHLLALNQTDELKRMYWSVLYLMLPAVVFPIISLFALSKPFVLSWVGADFEQSILIVQLLSLSNILAFVSYPSNMLLIALKRIRALYVLAALQPVIFWVTIGVFYPMYGYRIFAVSTLVSFLISGGLYIHMSYRFLNISLPAFIRKLFLPAVPAIIVILILFWLIVPLLPADKSKVNLLITVCTGGIVTLIGVFIYFLMSPPFKNHIRQLAGRFLPGRKLI